MVASFPSPLPLPCPQTSAHQHRAVMEKLRTKYRLDVAEMSQCPYDRNKRLCEYDVEISGLSIAWQGTDNVKQRCKAFLWDANMKDKFESFMQNQHGRRTKAIRPK